MKHLKGIRHAAAPEKEQGQIKKPEGKNPPQPSGDIDSGGNLVIAALYANNPQVVPDHEKPLHGSPRHIGPVGPVPQAAQEKDQEGVQESSYPSPAASPKRDVHILDKETGQSHMPSLPQLLDRTGLVGRIKVCGQLDVEHFSKAKGHVAVTAEIKVNFKGVGQDHQQRGGRIQKGRLIKAKVYGKGQHIRKQYLFGEAQSEKHDPLCKVFRLKPSACGILKLRHHFLVQDNGPGDELGEKGHKGDVVFKGIMRRPPKASVHDKGDLLEGKKADSQRKENVPQGKAGSEQGVYVLEEEIVIFKVKEKPKVKGKAEDEHDAAGGLCPGKFRKTAQQIIAKNAGDNNGEIIHVKVTVEPQRHPGQEILRCPVKFFAVQQIPAEQDKG